MATSDTTNALIDIESAVIQVETLASILHDLVELYGTAKIPGDQVGAIAFAIEHETRRMSKSALAGRNALR